MNRGLILTGLLGALTSAPAHAVDRMDVVFEDGLAGVRVTSCFAGTAPGFLYHHADAGKYARDIRIGSRELTLRRGTSTRLRSVADDSCLRWRTDLGQLLATRDYRLALRVGEDVLLSANLWFWKGNRDRPLEVTVTAPKGYEFSTPWPEISGRPGVYQPAHTPASWSARTALVRTPLQSLDLEGNTARVALVGTFDPDAQQKMGRWISNSLSAVSGVFGQFPRDTLQVLVVDIGRRSKPVVWAHVMRGGGPATEFFVDASRPLDTLKADWTAFHEFSHLLLPYVSSNDRWLSEGLASYYQNVLRARMGQLSEQQAWLKLYEGFERGRAGTQQESLAEATRAGRVMRVYWSGAAMMLMADTQLREQSGGRQSLDSVLKAFSACCRDDLRRWSAWDLLGELDRLSGTRIFRNIYRQHVDASAFPDLEQTFRALGLQPSSGRIRLVSDAPLAEVRESIMRSPG